MRIWQQTKSCPGEIAKRGMQSCAGKCMQTVKKGGRLQAPPPPPLCHSPFICKHIGTEVSTFSYFSGFNNLPWLYFTAYNGHSPSLVGSSTDFFMFAFLRKKTLPAESRSQVLPNLKVSWRNSFHRTRNSLPKWATWLDRAFIERECQRWNKTATQVNVQVEAFACKICGGQRARVHSSIQTTAVLAESSIPATYPRSSKSNRSKPLLPRDLTAHFIYKIKVVEIEYRSFQRKHQSETIEIRQQSLSSDNKKPFIWPNPTRDTPKDRSESEENNRISCKKPTATCVAQSAKKVMPVDCATHTSA